MADQTLDFMFADGGVSVHDKPATGPARHSMFFLTLAEFRRGMAAARRYDELKRCPASARADIPRRVFEEFYSFGVRNDHS